MDISSINVSIDPAALVRTDADIRPSVDKWCSLKTRKIFELENGHISQWDVSRVRDMSALFKGRKDFNEDLSQWDVRNVTNMYRMFDGASSYNQPLEQWNVKNVTNMDYMFQGASSFNQPLEQWDVKNVTDMSYMFCGASSFNQPATMHSLHAVKAQGQSGMWVGTPIEPQGCCVIV